MNTLKYTVIKSKTQYDEYCNELEELLSSSKANSIDAIELLTVLIEKWDLENNVLDDIDPIQLLKSLMSQNDLKAKDLCNILNLSKGTISKILNYQKGLSKESIRLLAKHFCLAQEVFNAPYDLLPLSKKAS